MIRQTDMRITMHIAHRTLHMPIRQILPMVMVIDGMDGTGRTGRDGIFTPVLLMRYGSEFGHGMIEV